MLGFIKKDLLMMKTNFRFVAVILVVYGVLAFQGKMDISFFLPFITVMLMTSTFSYDAFNKWDAYAITLPNGRENSVRAKYLSTILLIVISIIIGALLSVLIGYVHTGTIDFENVLFTVLIGGISPVLVLSFLYPAIYKFGAEKARIGVFLGVFGFVIIGGFIVKYIDLATVEKTFYFLKDYWAITLTIAMVLMTYISYKISEGIYKKKEF